LSFGSTGDAYDNAAMETFWARLKNEIAWIHSNSRAAAHAYLFEFQGQHQLQTGRRTTTDRHRRGPG